MHCPNCRENNGATTRFCTSCGAVLVESMPDGGRRRVLRPWGLRPSAPPTESPALPEIAAAYEAAVPPRSRRFAVAVVCGLALVAVAALVVYPYANADETPPRWHSDERAAARSRVVTVPALATVRESQLTAPALLEPPAARPAPAKAAALPAQGGQRNVSPRRVAPVIEASTSSTAAPEPTVIDARLADPPPAQPTRAPAPPDPWQPLREALALCSTSGGVFERAICEQRARLLHCDGYWGHVASCPDGRREYGQ